MKQATVKGPANGRRSSKEAVPDVLKLHLSSMLRLGEERISFDKALRRARKDPVTNHGREFAEKIAAALNAVKDRIPLTAWEIGQYVIFAKDADRQSDHCYAWCVSRSALDFFCYCSFWFSYDMCSFGRRLVSE